MWLGVGCPCPPVRNDIVTPRHLFPSFPQLSFIPSFPPSPASFPLSFPSFLSSLLSFLPFLLFSLSSLPLFLPFLPSCLPSVPAFQPSFSFCLHSFPLSFLPSFYSNLPSFLPSFLPLLKYPKKSKILNFKGRTDRWMDRWTDSATFRVACTQLKIFYGTVLVLILLWEEKGRGKKEKKRKFGENITFGSTK